jgi:hypothetical protein
MKYKIYYQEAGSVNMDALLVRINEYKVLFDSYMGKDNWAFTGSVAVVIHGHYNSIDMNDVSEPNDFDFMFESDQTHVMIKSIGGFNRVQQTLEKSVTFQNTVTNEAFDLGIVKKLSKTIVGGFPLMNANILLNNYDDPMSGRRNPADMKKIRVLNEVIAKNKLPLQEEQQPSKKGFGLFGPDSDEEESPKKGKGLFGSDSDEEESPKKGKGLFGSDSDEEESPKKGKGLFGSDSDEEESPKKGKGLFG